MSYKLLILALCAVAIHSQLCPAPSSCDVRCPSTNCETPDCACAVSEPCGIPLSDRPQIVYLTFDDAFTALAETNYYSNIFKGQYMNPNGCNIRATHFVTHQSNDYAKCNEYYNLGHEIASHSVTHRYNTSYWKSLDTQGWIDEFSGMREMINLYANIPIEDVVGTRAPYFQVGGDKQFAMMEDEGFLYDCSLVNQEYGFTNMENGIWPYTLDYRSNLNCQIAPCPTCEYKGIWEQPILDLEDNWIGAIKPDEGVPCTMLESCIVPESTADAMYDMLMKNFLRAWGGNTRAPIGFYMHSSFLFGATWHYDGLLMFLDEITTNPSYNDTWVVPIKDAIEYRKNPVPLKDLWDDSFAPFSCNNYPNQDCQEKSCPYYNVTNADLDLNEVRMEICGACPPEYPWLGNPAGD